MKEIGESEISEAVRNLCIEANCVLSEDVISALQNAKNIEESPIGKDIIGLLLENVRVAKDEMLPICQDTGVAVFFVEIGAGVKVNGNLRTAINEGVKRGYADGYLRKSMLKSPLDRVNTGDNTPAIIHFDLVPGDRLKITMLPKGGGSENMSRLKMLTPSEGWEGVKRMVVGTVLDAGSNPCPPIVVGVGIGGNFELAPLLAKKALIRDVGKHNPDPKIAALEDELLKEVNKTGIGPQGLGGRVTALALNIEVYPCHITALPVAVNIECHAHRHKEVVL
ncbi:MAG TPA: fumarate hydratase [bacterium]